MPVQYKTATLAVVARSFRFLLLATVATRPRPEVKILVKLDLSYYDVQRQLIISWSSTRYSYDVLVEEDPIVQVLVELVSPC